MLQQHVVEILGQPTRQKKKENFRRQEGRITKKGDKEISIKKENRVIDDAVTSTREKNLFSP
jgi:hypothetical protein